MLQPECYRPSHRSRSHIPNLSLFPPPRVRCRTIFILEDVDAASTVVQRRAPDEDSSTSAAVARIVQAQAQQASLKKRAKKAKKKEAVEEIEAAAGSASDKASQALYVEEMAREGGKRTGTATVAGISVFLFVSLRGGSKRSSQV